MSAPAGASPLSAPPGGRARADLLLLALAHAVTDTYSSFLPGLILFLVARLKLTNTAVGALATLLSITGSMSQLLFGHLADRSRRGIFLVVGPAAAAVFMSLLGLAPSLPALVLLLVLGGSGVACFHPQASVAAGAGHARRRGFDLALFVTFGTAGYALGPLFATAALEHLGPGRLWLAALPGLAMAAVLARRFLGAGRESGRVGGGECGHQECADTPLRPDAPGAQSADGSPAQSVSSDDPHTPTLPHSHTPPLARRRVQRVLFSLWAIVTLRSAVSTGLMHFLPLFCKQRGFTPLQGSLSVSLFLLSGAVSGLIGGPLSDRWGRRRVLVGSLALATPILALLTRVPSGAVLAVLLAGGFFLSLSAAINVAMAQEVAPQKQGMASAIVQGFAFGTGGLLVVLAGYLADHTSIAFVYQGLAWLPLLTVPVALTLPETVRPTKA